MENPEKSLLQLTSVEEVAEEILRDKSEIIALSKRRSGNQEAIRALSKQGRSKAWVALGPVLIKLPTDQARKLVEDDQRATEIQINTLRSDMKTTYNKLRDLEYLDPVPGLNLQPLSRDEMFAVQQVLGIKG